MTQASVTSLDRLLDPSLSFDGDAYLHHSDESKAANLDAAMRRAIQVQAMMSTNLRGVKRRHREQAFQQAGSIVVMGYNTVRWALGAWQDVTSYSSAVTAVANADRITRALDGYPSPDVLIENASETLRAFILDMVRFNSTRTVFYSLFGERAAAAVALTSLVDGMELALAEMDLFLSTPK